MDATGIGKPVYENLHSKLGDRLEGVVFTPEEKEIMAIEVKRGLEQREFLLSNDKEFHRQIHSIRRTSTGGKYFRYDAERNEVELKEAVTTSADAFGQYTLTLAE